jgi:hypothetical protein
MILRIESRRREFSPKVETMKIKKKNKEKQTNNIFIEKRK